MGLSLAYGIRIRYPSGYVVYERMYDAPVGVVVERDVPTALAAGTCVSLVLPVASGLSPRRAGVHVPAG